MANWIKMRTDLDHDPSVIGIAAALGIDEQDVIGRLWRIWSWADEQTSDGNAPTVTEAWIDRFVATPGFARAMAMMGWLSESGTTGIRFPNFERHMGQSAKARALTAVRVAGHRARNAPTVTGPLPEQNRTEQTRGESEQTGGNGSALDLSVWLSEIGVGQPSRGRIVDSGCTIEEARAGWALCQQARNPVAAFVAAMSERFSFGKNATVKSITTATIERLRKNAARGVAQ